MTLYCPYGNCGFYGTQEEVDDHRVSTHRDEKQEGSDLKHRPVEDVDLPDHKD